MIQKLIWDVIKYLKVVTGKYESEENKQVIMDIIN